MINKIVELIEVKTKNRPNSVLYTQWNASKDYVLNKLNTISHIFPHYSLHDMSHSEAILTNIERIIGKKTIEEIFSAEDLWLLLCSACYHDLGMFISGDEQKDLMTNEAFIEHVKKIQGNKKSYLYKYATTFETKDGTLVQKEVPIEDDTINALQFLIADFIRGKHGRRVAQCILCDEQLALHFIPKRLTKLLSEICEGHTKNFDDVMRLPHTEKGIHVEDCHPRYIAFLLRLGDLLDMDNNRFSDVILSTLPSLPIDSLQHRAKHFSISHLEVNSKKICASAICDDVEVADLTQKWFTILNEEVTNQMMKWSDIVPDTSYGFLPTIGELKVNLLEYDTIDGKFKNKFEIESTKALEIIQGAGLYSSKFQSIREILQNAVDATLLRVFIEHENEFTKLSPIEQRKEFRELCKQYPIIVSLQKHQTDSDEDGNFVIWDICVQDSGVGMSQDDIKFLTNTASNNENITKKNIIQRMPDWMRPSGTFGIGFQSIFLLTDIVKIYSRRFNSEKAVSLKLYNPIKEKEGLILLKTKYSDNLHTGTKILFSLRISAIPSSWSVTMDKNCYAFQTLHSYDFVKDHSLDIDIAHIRDEISSFAYASDIPIILKNGNEDKQMCASHVNEFQYFSFNNHVEISADFVTSSRRQIDKTFYRGQSIDKSINNEIRFVNFSVNILGGDAKDILTLNRNEIRREYRTTLYKRIIDTIKEFIIEKYNKLPAENKKWASMFLHFYNSEFQQQIDLEKYSDWYKHKITSMNGKQPKTLKKILDSPKIAFRELPLSLSNKKETPSYTTIDKNTIAIHYSFYDDDIFLLHQKVVKQYRYSYINSYEEGGQIYNEIIYTKVEPENVMTDIKQWFIHYKDSECYARGYMPCQKQYRSLAVKHDEYRADYIGYFPYIGEVMVCPYTIVNKMSNRKELRINLEDDELYQYVYEHRADETITLEDIRSVYKQFYEDTKKIIEEINCIN